MVSKACCHHWVGWCLISGCAPFLPGRHIEKLDTVLEFGGRYATTTCAIALQQENSGHINHHHHSLSVFVIYSYWDLCIEYISPPGNRKLYYNTDNNHHNIYQVQRSTIQGQEKNTLSVL